MKELRSIPIRRIGNRHNLFMGGDRELVMFSGLLSFALIFTGQTAVTTLFGLFLWFLMLFLFRLMAKSDPMMRFVYLRNLRYRSYYPPRATPFRINTVMQGNRYK